MDIKAKIADFLRSFIMYRGKTFAPNSIQRSSSQEVLQDTLLQLQCKYEQEEWNKDYLSYRFSYQGGYFLALVSKTDSCFVNLYFHSIMSVGEAELPLVRYVCNYFNDMPVNIKVYYSFDSKTNEYDINLCSNLFLNGDITSPTNYLSDNLTTFFDIRRKVCDEYDGIKKKYGQEVYSKDVEAVENADRRELNLFLEAEMRHGQDSPSYCSQHSTLIPLLSTLFDIDNIQPLSLTVAGGTVTTITDASQIASYNPVTSIIDGEGADACFCETDSSTLTFTFCEESSPSCRRTMIIYIKAERTTDHVLYARLTATLIPLPASKEHACGTRVTTPYTGSVVIAYDKKSVEQLRQEFCYMYNDAQDKMARGDSDALTDEQRLIVDITQQPIGHDLYWGHKCVRQERYYEATRYLLNAYHRLNPLMPQLNERQRDTFYEVLFLLGFSYCAMQRYEQAYFYLDALFPLNRVHYTMEYINNLVNSHDFRAAHVISGLLDRLNAIEQEANDNEEELNDGLRTFRNFLRRRQVYVLIDQADYAAATNHLNKMILEPENTDFALNELAYIEKIVPSDASAFSDTEQN